LELNIVNIGRVWIKIVIKNLYPIYLCGSRDCQSFLYGSLLYPHFNCKIFSTPSITLSNPSTHSPQMASPTLQPQKKLAEFLNDEQEPFILQLYLSERDYSNRWSSNGEDSTNTSTLNRKKKGLLPFFYLLKALYKKLSFPKETKTVLTKVHECDQRNKHEGLDHILQFSSDTRFTMFSSCQDIDEEGTSVFSHKQQHLFYSHTLYNMAPQQR